MLTAMGTRPPRTVSPEALSEAGAGALLLTVAIVELALAFWAAGWWHRAGGLLAVAVGAALLAHGAAIAAGAAAPRLRRPESPREQFPLSQSQLADGASS
jgi:hypothetical protein